MTQTYDLAVDAGIDVISVNNGLYGNYEAVKPLINSGERVSGIKKLTQRFIQMLLTLPPTSVATPNIGSYLLNTLQNSNVEDADTVLLNIRAMIESTARQLQDLETDDDPPEEQLLAADISEPIRQDDKVGLGIILITRSNETAQFTLPLDTLMSL
jgi:hypothetical protein